MNKVCIMKQQPFARNFRNKKILKELFLMRKKIKS